MSSGQIVCPNCGHEFELSDALTARIRDHLKAELLEEVARREAELKKRGERLETRERELARGRAALEEELEKRLREKLAEAEKAAARRLEADYGLKLKEMAAALAEKEAAIRDFREQELSLRTRQRKLEEEREALQLEVARKIDAEREAIRAETLRRAAEDHRLKDLEKDKVIQDLKAALEEMKRRAEQGSMETQGEVLELDFEARLRSAFLHDDIQPVPKGIRGADLIQTVRTPLGAACGVVLWETKNTKAWSAAWIPKLKDDMILTRATVAILVSVVLPEGVRRFGRLDGVWVCDPESAIPLAAVLREHLLALSREREAAVGKNEKMEALYRYLSGEEFRQKIEGIVEAFGSLQEQLNKERRAMERIWSQREKEIQRVLRNTAALYGDMQGIIGGRMPAIAALELDPAASPRLPGNAEAGGDGEIA